MKPLALSLAAILLATPFAHSDVEETRTTLRTHVFQLINRDRQLHKLPPLKLDLQVSAMGDEYCARQIANRTTGHFTTDGLFPYMRYSFAGGNDGLSENAAGWSANYRFSERALYEMITRSEEAMMGEAPPNDGHRKAILDPHATHVGIGLAWEKGQFRLVEELIRRYIRWTQPIPRSARPGDLVTIGGQAMPGASIEAITVHYEPLPQPMTAAAASAIDSYSLPEKRKEYLPRLKSEYTRRYDGTVEYIRREYADGRRGDFSLDKDGNFSFDMPLTDGPGIYTAVVWVRRNPHAPPFSASNIAVRVEGSPREMARGTR